MAYRLKNRNRAVPNGMIAYDSATNFKPEPWSDFEAQCRGWQLARLGNPGLTRRYRKSTDLNAIRDEVDLQLGQMCHDLGLNDFVIQVDSRTEGGGSPGNAVPFPGARNRVAAVAAGVKTIYEWIRSKEEAVAPELSNVRANTCAECPLNGKENLLDFFEIKAGEAILAELEKRKGWNLSTPFDDKLGVCHACFCVNALSVHCPLEVKLKHLPPENFAALHEKCWVRTEKESKAQ